MIGLRIHSYLYAGAFCVLATFLSACGNSYSAPEINGRVEDTVTGMPIENAVVVLVWISRQNSIAGHGLTQGPIKVIEVLTDANGNFTSPAWGPMDNPYSGFADAYQPHILVYKAGYYLGGFDNYESFSTVKHYDFPSELDSRWNGKVLGLEKRASGSQSKACELGLLFQAFYPWDGTFSHLAKAPCMTVVTHSVTGYCLVNGVRNDFHSLSRESIYGQVRGQCKIADQLQNEVADDLAAWRSGVPTILPYR